MIYKSGYEILGLPEYFKFGIEIEANNVNTFRKNGLYKGESADYIKSKGWHMATKSEETLVGKGGAEVVSPVLSDSKKSWQDILDMCNHIKNYPGKKGDKVVADHKCGLHVSFDANCISSDPKRMYTFKRLYAESEELLFKMCNAENDPIRPSAINKNCKGLLNLISSFWRRGMAAPIGKKILKAIKNNTLKVNYKKFGRFRSLAAKYKLDERRYASLNLTDIGNPKKNRIEFRMSNGTLDPEIIKQNVFLYASLIETSIKIADNPEKFKDKLNSFYETNISEEEKAKRFLDLIMETPEDRKIFMDRWRSVKDAPVFAKNDKKGFAPGRFKREEFKNIARRTKNVALSKAFNYLKGLISRNQGEKLRGK